MKTPPKLPTPGLYENLVDDELHEQLEQLDERAYEVAKKLAPMHAAEAFARYLYLHSRRALARIDKVEQQRVLVDALLLQLDAGRIPQPTRQLLAVADPEQAGLAEQRFPGRPKIPLAESEILVNARGELDFGAALMSELPSADRVDLICAFIKRTGLARLVHGLRELTERRPAQLRVLTTTYTGVTESDALAQLVELGATVKVDYEGRTTRLHAKAWVLHRNSGLSTAYVGSSNISHSALADGREWNVRLSARENPDLLAKLAAEFEALWQDSTFQPFDAERFARARERERGPQTRTGFVRFDLRPFGFQDDILERLDAARVRHGHHRNLVVAATGTGKTMIAAFDYARLRKTHPRLLFVAHRKEILEQAQWSFQGVLGDLNFGELLVDGHKPSGARQVFASIQSLHHRIDEIDPHDYDYVIIDEFHHAEARTYQQLLSHLKPRELLGLTATPERGDGKDITRFFDGRITAELRLWEALERGFLCPFQYFGVSDNSDLRSVNWRQGGYDRAELEGLFTGNHARVIRILEAIRSYVPNSEAMRALGFCVGVEHARFMASAFVSHGIPAAAVVGSDLPQDRETALSALRNGDIRVLFCVDIFNEGVDIPEVDTLLFLRPTESATLFLQQLGRGLRRHPDKEAAIVLDFIGNAHRNFRFDRRFRRLVADGIGITEQIEQDFPYLPPGCAIVLEPQSRAIVLANVRAALSGRRPAIVEELRMLARASTPSLEEFLNAMQWHPKQLYRSRDRDWTYTGLRQDAGALAAEEVDPKIVNSLANLLHVDDRLRLGTWQQWLAESTPPKLTGLALRDRRLMIMLLAVLFNRDLKSIVKLGDGMKRVWRQSTLRDELSQLFAVVAKNCEHLDGDFPQRPDVPLRLHASYQRDEILAACGVIDIGDFPNQQIGIRRVEHEQLILNFATISKTKGYSPKHQYRDFAISRTCFHSETTHSIGPTTSLGRDVIEHVHRDLLALLFVRARKKDERNLSAPYVFLGPAKLAEWTGDRPMQLTWELSTPIPAWFYPQTCLVT